MMPLLSFPLLVDLLLVISQLEIQLETLLLELDKRALALKQALQLHLELSEVTVSKLLMKLRDLLGGKLAGMLLAIEQEKIRFDLNLQRKDLKL